MTDVFRECREMVSAQDAARHYGLAFDRKGWAVCPFHRDKHPSMSFRAGRFRCWACNASGDSIDFTGRLLGLEPLAAVERLNADFSLALPLHRQLTPAERREAAQAAQHQREVSDTYRLFEQWRGDMIRWLNACFRLAHLTMKTIKTPANLDRLTGAQALAIREQAHVEYLADVLTGGDMSATMTIFRERRQVSRLIEQILNHSLTKSGVA